MFVKRILNGNVSLMRTILLDGTIENLEYLFSSTFLVRLDLSVITALAISLLHPQELSLHPELPSKQFHLLAKKAECQRYLLFQGLESVRQ